MCPSGRCQPSPSFSRIILALDQTRLRPDG
jgi:hypothetical protein